uniref:hypothetical protein n=1 Tax=Polynucleobacter sp. TaxID=2029855 RepID=UPI004047A573
MKNPSFCLLFLIFLSSCATVEEKKPENIPSQEKKTWNLTFYHFYKDKQTHTESFEYPSRRDCFEAMYQMQVDSRKRKFYSGGGICTKWFSQGQQRTHDDVLGYR